MITDERIEEIMDASWIERTGKSGTCADEVVDGLLEGLKLFRELTSERIGYETEYDKLCGPTQEELPGLTEDHILRLETYGWHWDGENFCKMF